MIDKSKKISVIVPVYNTSDRLNLCVKSITEQTYTNLEIILVDDGSTDNSGELCDKLALQDNRIKVIHQKNAGLSSARNTGMENATADYVAFVDSDDTLNPCMYQKLMDAMTEYDTDFVLCDFHQCFDDGHKKRITYILSNGYYDKEKIEKEVFNRLIGEYELSPVITVAPWNKLCKKSFLIKNNIHYQDDLTINEDKVYSPQLFYFANSFYYLKNECLYDYYMSEKSLSNAYSEGLFDNAKLVEKYLNDVWKNSSKYDFSSQIYTSVFAVADRALMQEAVLAKRKKITFFEAYKRLKAMVKDPWLTSLSKRFNINLLSKIRRLECKAIRHKMTFLLLVLMYRYPRGKMIEERKSPLLIRLIRKMRKKFRDYQLNLLRIIYYINFSKKKNGLSFSERIKETKKYLNAYKLEYKAGGYTYNILIQSQHISKAEFSLYSDNLVLDKNPLNPILLVVVKDDCDRMKVLFEHYRNLGINQFVVLDNNSTDGTLEFLSTQENTRVYQILEEFQTQKKEAWIEKLLVKLRYNRWYIVADSDELIDYQNSEKHSLIDVIKWADNNNCKRLGGYLVDMYSKNALFEQNLSPDKMTEEFCCFDTDSYLLNKNNKGVFSYSVLGGPRKRVFGTDCSLSKECVFYFDKHTLFRNCHFLLPSKRWEEIPRVFAIKHYKFLSKDKKVYKERVEKRNFFAGSKEYVSYCDKTEQNPDMTFIYENTAKYDNSKSLSLLPYLEVINFNEYEEKK